MIPEIKRSAWFGIPLLLMLGGFIYLHPLISIGLNPDLTSYFAIARHYSRFQFQEALNAYWSPMISWLLTPFFWMNLDPLLSLRLLMILIAIGVYWKSVLFIRILTLNKWIRFSATLIVALLNLYYALSAQTPDFLSVFFILVFIHALIRLRAEVRSMVILGITVLACFFTKSFLLPYTLFLVFVYFIYCYWKQKNAQLIKLSWSFILILSIGLVIWAGLMKYRYDRWMLSSAYAYNTTVFGPQGDKMHYTSYASLIDPPSEHATFGWQDPTFFKVEPVYFWTSRKNFTDQLQTWEKNLTMWPYLFRYFSWFSYGLLILPCLTLLSFKRREARFAFLLYLGFFILLSAYSLVFIKERYLAPGHYLIVFTFVHLFDFFENKTTVLLKDRGVLNHFMYKGIGIGFALLLLVGFIKNPVQQIRYCMNEKEKLEAETDLAYELAMTGLLDHSRVATFTSSTGLYNYMPLACYLSEASFFGELTVWKPAKAQEEELLSKQIDFFLYNNCSNMDVDGNCLNEEIPSWLEQYPVVYENKKFKVKILDLRQVVPLRREEQVSFLKRKLL